jgi:hypothetical protein
MKKMLIVSLMLAVMLAVPAFAGDHDPISSPAKVEAGSFAAVMGISQTNGWTLSNAWNSSEAQVKFSVDPTVTTYAASSGGTAVTTVGSGDAIAAQTGAALATYGSGFTATFSPFAPGSLISFGIAW